MSHDGSGRTDKQKQKQGLFPADRQEAEAHITNIRIRKGLNDVSDSLRDLESALDLLSYELYQTPFRFLLELLQNADDNSYEVPQPTMAICLKDRMLRIDTNEVGFTKENVEAICSIGQSSKSSSQQGVSSIGEKGIGFKSVFKAADVVWVTSGHYAFKFDAHKKLGRLAPFWAEFPWEHKYGQTSILLKFRTDWNVSAFEKELLLLDAKVLLFLRRISRIEINIATSHEKDARCSVLTRGTLRNQRGGLETLALDPDVQSPYIIFRYKVTLLQQTGQRGDSTEVEITFAFPRLNQESILLQSQYVYSYLPVRDYGFKFILQAGFNLIANREDIDSSTEWNKLLLKHIPKALLAAIVALNSGEMRYSWLSYLPINIEEKDLFNAARKETLQSLSSEPILESIDETLQAPSDLVFVPDHLCDGDRPLIPSQCSIYRYISPKYAQVHLHALAALGVKTLSDSEFLDDLSQFVTKHWRVFQNMSLEWHSQLSKALIPLIQDHRNRISSLPIIQLRNGEWLAHFAGAFLLPLKVRSLTIPSGLPILEIHPAVEYDVSRRELLRLLGIAETSPEMVCEIIKKTHAGTRVSLEHLSIADLISHASFIYEARYPSLRGLKLWFVAEDGSRHRASQLYVNDPSLKASAFLVLGRRLARFLHEGYEDAFYRCEDWRKWIDENLGVARIPRLVSHWPDNSSGFAISNDFKRLTATSSPSDILNLLRCHWENYEPYIKPQSGDFNNAELSDSSKIIEDSKCAVRSFFYNLKVPCLGGLTMELCKTYLPREKVLLGLGLSELEVGQNSSWISQSNSRLSILNSKLSRRSSPDHPLLDIADPEAGDWDFLQYFNAIVALEAKHFVGKLRQLSGDYVNLSLVSSIYEHLMACTDERDVGDIIKAFWEEKLIFIPASDASTTTNWEWVSAGECVWNGPACLLKTPVLQRHYSEPAIRRLFRRLVEIPTANLSTLIAEMQQINTGDSLTYITSILMETGSMMADASFTEITEVSAKTKLSKAKIWPVVVGNSTSEFDSLMDSDEVWYIADHKHLREAFIGKLPYLAIDRSSLDYMSDLLNLLGVQRRLLSKNANCEYNVGGNIKGLLNYTKLLRKKARFIARLVPVSNRSKEGCLNSLQNIEVFQAQHVSIWWSIVTLNGEIVHGGTEKGRVYLVPQANKLQIYLVEQDVNVSSPPLELAEQLSKFCGITNAEHISLLHHVLVQQNIRRIADDFDKRGLQADALGFQSIKGNLDEDEERLSAYTYEAQSDVVMQSNNTIKAQRSTKGHTVLYNVIQSPNGTMIDHRPKDSQVSLELEGENSTSGDVMVTSEPLRPLAKASGKFSKQWSDDHNGYKLIKTKPSNKPLKYGLVSLPFPAVSLSGVDEDEYMLSSELYISTFLQEVLGDSYHPSDHWTSPLRSKAGYSPVRDIASDCSTFTILDVSGKFRKFLLGLGCKSATSMMDPATFHLQVVLTAEPSSSSFTLTAAQVEKAERLSEKAKKVSLVNELYVLAVVSSFDHDPIMSLYADPWHLRQNGLLILEAQSDYWARVVDGADPLYTRKASNTRTMKEDKFKYRHRSLKLSEIRLLKLLPSTDEYSLRGTIEAVPLDATGEFHALSYVWGPSSKSITQHCLHTPEGIINITASLHSALTAVRRQQGIETLWVDAICINQEDSTEKVIQIRLMNDIFRRAVHVIAWLGFEQDESDQVIETLNNVYHQYQSSYWPTYLGGDTSMSAVVPSQSDRFWINLDALLDRSWFKRMWIIQELVLPVKSVLLCGKSQIEWDAFFESLRICEQNINRRAASNVGDVRVLAHASAAYALGITRNRLRKENQKFRLLELMELFSHGQATIELDKIFALLSIAFDSGHQDFDPDYESPKEQVVQRYANRLVLNGQTMELICRAGISKSYLHCSWIPNWTSARFPDTISTWTTPKGKYYAGPRGPSIAKLDNDCKPGSTILQIQGFEVDTIVSIKPLRTSAGNHISYQDALEDFRNIMKHIEHYPFGESLEDILVQLPIGNANAPYLEAVSQETGRCGRFAKQYEGTWPDNLKQVINFSGHDVHDIDASKIFTEYRTTTSLYWRTAAVFMNRISKAMLCLTEKGFLGLVPGESLRGDQICVLHGGRAPFVMRSHTPQHVLVGEAYIHGIMHGEALVLSGIQERVFHLI